MSAFTGTMPGAGGKGLVDLIIFKWDVAKYVMNDWAISAGVDVECIMQCRAVLSSVASYRKAVGYTDGPAVFRAGWRLSAESLFTLCEGLCFDVMYDAQLKEALKAHKGPCDALTAQLAEPTARISAMVEEEKQAEPDEDEAEEEENGDAPQKREAADGTSPSEAQAAATKRRRTDGDAPSAAVEAREEDPARRDARRVLQCHVQFVTDMGGTDKALAAAIAETAAGRYQVKEAGCQGKGYVLVVYDPANLGESTSHPHLRKPALQAETVARVTRVGLMARAATHTGSHEVKEIGEELRASLA